MHCQQLLNFEFEFLSNNYQTVFIHCRQMASQLSGLPQYPPCQPDFLLGKFCPDTTANMIKKLSEQYVVRPTYTRPIYRYDFSM